MGGPPRILRALLRLYPPAHRRAYGEEMWEAVAFRYASAPGPVRGAVAAAADLSWNALVTWGWTARRRGGAMGRGWWLDARFVARSVARSRGYAATVVLVMVGAVAVNATVFSYVRGTLLDRPPFEDPDRVMIVWGSNTVEGQLRDVISGPNYVDMDREVRTLSPLAAFHFGDTYLTGEGPPEILPAMEATVDFLDVLGVRPALGRDFDERDRTSSAPANVLVSWSFWRDRLGGSPGAVGGVVRLEGEPHTVLGVLPEDFEFAAPVDFVTPLRDDLLAADARYRIHYHVVGRLVPGATPEQATRELSELTRRIAAEYPGFERWSALVEPLHRVSVSAVRPVIWTLTGVVGLVLLIALVNLATLFRIRAVSRADELAVRVALGAGWGRVARLLSLEAAGLALAGALGGVAVTPFLLHRITSLLPPTIPIPDSAVRLPALRALLDPWVAAAAVGAAVLGALLLTAPGLLATARARPQAAHRIHRGVRGARLLVGAEVALATVLCLGAALTARSAARLLSTEVGLEDRELLVAWVGDVWGRDAAGQVTYFREVVQAVEALPGVRSAAVIDYPDFLGEDDFQRVYFLDRSFQPLESQREEWRRVGPGLFETTGMAMRAGRGFDLRDFEGPPRAAVVNESFARKHYPGGQAVGEYVSLGNEAYRDMEIVGIVQDLRSRGPAAPPTPMLYVPNQGDPRGTQGLYVRVDGEPAAFQEAVRSAIWSVDSGQPVAGMAPMSEVVGAWVAIPRATRALLAVLAAMALSLAAVGVFGVVAFAIRTRRSELGVRLALGASPERLGVEVAGGMVSVSLLGIGAGLVVGVAAGGAAGALLHGVTPLDPLSLVAAAAAMAAAALVASWLPVRRVRRIDPCEAIRAE